jgi:hypothetical protein
MPAWPHKAALLLRAAQIDHIDRPLLHLLIQRKPASIDHSVVDGWLN